MSTRELRTLPLMYTRTNRKRKVTLDVDLNVALPSVNRDHEGTSSQPLSEGGGATGPQSVSVPAPPIIVDDDADNDVIISSPRAFTEARNNSGRSRGGPRPIVIIDVDQEEYFSKAASTRWTERRRVPTKRQSIIHCDHYINLERETLQEVAPPPPPPPEPTFSCPICMGPLVEEMSTKCGHIFCKSCIKAAIAVQKKCPTCRKKTTMKDIIRVYLPSSN